VELCDGEEVDTFGASADDVSEPHAAQASNNVRTSVKIRLGECIMS
jgi:hypothetical protein